MDSRPPYRLHQLPIGKTKAYQEIHAGRLHAVKCGKLTLILPEDYDLYLKSLAPFPTKATGGGRCIERTPTVARPAEGIVSAEQAAGDGNGVTPRQASPVPGGRSVDRADVKSLKRDAARQSFGTEGLEC